MKENFAAKNEAYQPKIKIIGVGDCGTSVVNKLIEHGISNIDLFVLDSDKKSLDSSILDIKSRIQIGEKIANGLGTGGNPNVGEKAAEESIDEIRKIIKGTDILFIINGIAGGLAGTIPVIAKLAKEQGAVNIVFAVTPAKFEGEKKNGIAEKALKKLNEEQTGVDAIINVSNTRFIELVDRKAILLDLFNLTNEEISKCIKAFVDIFQEEKGIIAVGFKDFKDFIKNVGFTGIGISKKHKFDEIKSAIEEVMNYPLIRGSFESAEKVLINIQSGSDFTLNLVQEIVEEFTNKIKEDAEVILSVQIDKDYFSSNEFKIMVITA